MKHYTIKQFTELTGIKVDTLHHRLIRDQKKPVSKRRYPDAKKFGRDWMIPSKYFDKTKDRQ